MNNSSTRKSHLGRPPRVPVLQHDLNDSDSESDADSNASAFDSDGDGDDLEKPKGLIDGLSRFFTPSNKRKSRVSSSSYNANVAAVFKAQIKSKLSSQNQSKSQQAAYKLIKKSKLLQVNKGQRRMGRPRGTVQLNGLFDGLSHLFTAQGDSRQRTSSTYSPPQQKIHESMDFDVYSPSMIDVDTIHTSTPIRSPSASSRSGDCERPAFLSAGRGRGSRIHKRDFMMPGLSTSKKPRCGSRGFLSSAGSITKIRGRSRGRVLSGPYI